MGDELYSSLSDIVEEYGGTLLEEAYETEIQEENERLDGEVEEEIMDPSEAMVI